MPASGAPSDDPMRPQILAPLDVLLADDNPANRRAAELILNAAGATVTTVSDGAEALLEAISQALDAAAV